MKEAKRYICDICKKEHITEGAALMCEKSHHMPIKTVRDGVFEDVKGYPMSIMVTFENGEDLIYEYKCGMREND